MLGKPRVYFNLAAAASFDCAARILSGAKRSRRSAPLRSGRYVCPKREMHPETPRLLCRMGAVGYTLVSVRPHSDKESHHAQNHIPASHAQMAASPRQAQAGL